MKKESKTKKPVGKPKLGTVTLASESKIVLKDVFACVCVVFRTNDKGEQVSEINGFGYGVNKNQSKLLAVTHILETIGESLAKEE
jgi:hypothetical protein